MCSLPSSDPWLGAQKQSAQRRPASKPRRPCFKWPSSMEAYQQTSFEETTFKLDLATSLCICFRQPQSLSSETKPRLRPSCRWLSRKYRGGQSLSEAMLHNRGVLDKQPRRRRRLRRNAAEVRKRSAMEVEYVFALAQFRGRYQYQILDRTLRRNVRCLSELSRCSESNPRQRVPCCSLCCSITADCNSLLLNSRCASRSAHPLPCESAADGLNVLLSLSRNVQSL
jgi:hypothetical protein